MYDKYDFMEMIRDWQADNAPEFDGLVIDEPEIDEGTGKWEAIAHDANTSYIISDDSGNIIINYLGTK